METGQLRWRCRRGMKELDVLFQRYLDERLESAGASERAAFEALLEIQDPVIYAYCFGSLEPPAQFVQLIELMIGRPSG